MPLQVADRSTTLTAGGTVFVAWAPRRTRRTLTDGLRIEVTLPGSVEASGRRSANLALRQWHGWRTSARRRDRMIFVDGTIVEADGRTLHVGGHRFNVEAAGPQTIVRVTRATPPATDELDWDAYYDDIDEGWLSFLQQLRFVLTSHWDVPRHTIHLDGTAAEPTTAPVAMGLDVTAAPGERYGAEVAGERLTGEVWFRSTHQLGLEAASGAPACSS